MALALWARMARQIADIIGGMRGERSEEPGGGGGGGLEVRGILGVGLSLGAPADLSGVKIRS